MREYRKIALGVLKWSPSEFQKATVWDIEDAIAGMNPVEKKPGSLAPTKEEFLEWKAAYDAYEESKQWQQH